MKAVLQYRASPGFRAQIAETAPDWLDITVIDEFDKAAFSDAMRDAEVLLHVLEPVTAEVIEAAPLLRFIQKIGVGVNTIALEAAEAKGIAVANMPETNSRAVAEMTLMLMLAALRQTGYFDAETRAGRGWAADLDAFDRIGEIHGRTVGLVGYGAVAVRLTPVLKALGATVLYTATRPKPGADAGWRTLDALLRESDVVSLHLPLSETTRNLIDEPTLAMMKRGSVLINTARGGLVDEPALVAALESGHLTAAGLDVFAEEPVDPGNPLLAMETVVVMPHIAWLTPETLDRSLGIAFENCRRLRDEEPLLHRVL